MKLWQKESTSVSELVEKFTVGRDKEFDLLLAKHDVQGSIAHVTMLGEVGLMTKEEAIIAVKALEEIANEIQNSKFKIQNNVEDVHSQVELMPPPPRPGGSRHKTIFKRRSTQYQK
jgi:argininosuccinate lyase